MGRDTPAHDMRRGHRHSVKHQAAFQGDSGRSVSEAPVTLDAVVVCVPGPLFWTRQMKSHPRRFAQFFVWWKDGSWEAAATYNGALDTAPTARVAGFGAATVKAVRRHPVSAGDAQGQLCQSVWRRAPSWPCALSSVCYPVRIDCEAAATHSGALDTAPTARVTGLGTANVKAVRRHTASALPECLEESAELALRALEPVLPRANRLRGNSCVHWHTRHSAHCACDRVGDREREGGEATHRVSSARVFGGERRAGPARS